MNSVSSNFIPELGNETIAGAYPVSMELGWHGGTHLIAPPGEEATTLPVRAIADGTVIYARQPTAQNRNDDEPLNYGAPAGSSCWTSDGTVLIRHETDIGASPDGQAISVVFYSLYMHLDSIAEGVARNRRIYRKEELGSAGSRESCLSRALSRCQVDRSSPLAALRAPDSSVRSSNPSPRGSPLPSVRG